MAATYNAMEALEAISGLAKDVAGCLQNPREPENIRNAIKSAADICSIASDRITVMKEANRKRQLAKSKSPKTSPTN